MSARNEAYEVELSFGSLIYLGFLVGLSGGAVVGVLTALYQLASGHWIVASATLVLSPLTAGITLAIHAALGYPVYRQLSRRTPVARRLTGVFARSGAEH